MTVECILALTAAASVDGALVAGNVHRMRRVQLLRW